ncbi:tetratricopeptide repeat protein [Brucella neotomae]|uniref:TPR repeat-containing protein n=1 Tax=Brucella neotomae 5K33 TaxID=520456 RepID=A0A7U8PVQ2_BRUNE|nr:tetratricopeptide repeat protein [Brucella neotomae]EEY02286.1 TPR repeat-containing protein [Brucella neotomae 5K33]KEX96049.1 GlcNAc transferase [Brucella neotomae 5K33]KFJ57114.1 tetratricopeptide repeat family protein [Brucella neotomae 5K33]SPU69101.1 TPR repeat-containing protein [Brucella neotomae]SPU69690.1 TPR repeat-containing protein [Brucella neotomae]
MLQLAMRLKVMQLSETEVSGIEASGGAGRNGLIIAAALLALTVAGCQSTNSTLSTVDRAQGSSENISSLTSVIQSNPRDPEGYNVRGSAYGKAGRYKEAMRDFDQAYANRALVDRYMGDNNKAVQDYSRAIQLNPQYDAAYIGRGNVYRQAGHLDQALNDFNQAIALRTTDGRAYHNRGLIYQAKGLHKQAIEDFSKAISLNSTAPEPYNGRGISYVALGDYDNAFDDFNTAITLDQNVAESWANQALVYEHNGDKAKAANSYARAVQLDPKYKPAKDGLARTRG